MLKKKIKAGTGSQMKSKTESEGLTDEEKLTRDYEEEVTHLSHPGRIGYQLILHLQRIAQALEKQNELAQERNGLLKEGYEDSEEEEEEEEDEG